METFPLMRLPHCAISVVLKHLDHIEMFILSKCSQRALNLIKFGGARKFTLLIDEEEEFSVGFDNEQSFELVGIPRSAGIKEFSIAEQNAQNLEIYFNKEGDEEATVEQYLEAFESFVSYLFNSFKWKVNGLSICCRDPAFADKLLETLKSLMRKQLEPIDSLHLADLGDGKIGRWILNNVIVSSEIDLINDYGRNFNIDFYPACKTIEIVSARWLTVANVLSFTECESINLQETEWNVERLNELLEEWKKGRLPNLQWLQISSIPLPDNANVLGFTPEELKKRRNSSREGYNENWCSCGKDFQTPGGINASIQYSMDIMRIELFVWKD